MIARSIVNVIFVLLFLLNSACENLSKEMRYKTFKEDYELLKLKDPELRLLQDDDGEGMIIVSPGYQGKVFTSSFSGMEGRSLGWVNKDAITSDTLDSKMNAYGGENRLWIGPEGSRFSVFFAPGADLTYANWKTPPPIDYEKWQLENATSKSIALSHDMRLKNHAGTEFSIRIERSISLLNRNEVIEELYSDLHKEIQMVAYSTDNVLINTGTESWDRESGTVCLWMLDMFEPSDETIIIVPHKKLNENDSEAITSDYFGEISNERLVWKDGRLFFKADGRSRGKLGVAPQFAVPWAASYDPVNHIFTYIQFDLDPEAVYLNQEWTTEGNPYKGDAVNAYNDGPIEGGGQLGPFFELESCSPAAFLKSGERIQHGHKVFHFSGEEKFLAPLLEKLTGVHTEILNQRLFN